LQVAGVGEKSSAQHRISIENFDPIRAIDAAYCSVCPNITGTVPSGMFKSATAPSGCFTRETASQPHFDGGSSEGRQLDMDASLVSSIYGNASTVQPPSFQALVCIKT
jgi:hypothetical protein